MRRVLAVAGAALLIGGSAARAEGPAPGTTTPSASIPREAAPGSTRPTPRPTTGATWSGPTLAEAAVPGLGARMADADRTRPDAATLDAPPALDAEAAADPCPFVAADPIRLARLAAIAGEEALAAEAPFRLPQARRCDGG